MRERGARPESRVASAQILRSSLPRRTPLDRERELTRLRRACPRGNLSQYPLRRHLSSGPCHGPRPSERPGHGGSQSTTPPPPPAADRSNLPTYPSEIAVRCPHTHAHTPALAPSQDHHATAANLNLAEVRAQRGRWLSWVLRHSTVTLSPSPESHQRGNSGVCARLARRPLSGSDPPSRSPARPLARSAARRVPSPPRPGSEAGIPHDATSRAPVRHTALA
ncbi:hypothetical protein BC628DRAFT_705365 [Trametes gibbosa]|nr:hypothetical protein BC628DRAFT_705365 [Trametes gibbosa]